MDSSTSRLLPLESISLEGLQQRLRSFFRKHGSDSPLDLLVPTELRFQSIRHWNLTKKLDILAQLAHQRKSNERFLDLEVQVQRRRLIYEDIVTNKDPHNEAFRELLLLNASGWFKCHKRHCDFFFDGFANKEDRDKHIDQHERPFRCSFEECPHAKLGYGTEKELKRHEKKSHPSGQDSEWAFPTYKPKRNLEVSSASEKEDLASAPLDIFSASTKGDLATLQRLVREGANVRQTDRWPTPLMLALRNDHADVAKYLIEQGAEKDWPINVSWAVRHASISALRMLLETEADPTRRIESAQIALENGEFNNWVDAIPLVLSYGADINHKNIGGITPLQHARMSGRHVYAQALLEHGALDDLPPETLAPATLITPRSGASASPSVHNLLN